MWKSYSLPLAITSVLLLPGCQYFSFFKTDTTYYASHYNSSPEATCSSLGAMSGDSSMDWCIASEEAGRERQQERLHASLR